jgi:hypothetical protein
MKKLVSLLLLSIFLCGFFFAVTPATPFKVAENAPSSLTASHYFWKSGVVDNFNYVGQMNSIIWNTNYTYNNNQTKVIEDTLPEYSANPTSAAIYMGFNITTHRYLMGFSVYIATYSEAIACGYQILNASWNTVTHRVKPNVTIASGSFNISETDMNYWENVTISPLSLSSNTINHTFFVRLVGDINIYWCYMTDAGAGSDYADEGVAYSPLATYRPRDYYLKVFLADANGLNGIFVNGSHAIINTGNLLTFTNKSYLHSVLNFNNNCTMHFNQIRTQYDGSNNASFWFGFATTNFTKIVAISLISNGSIGIIYNNATYGLLFNHKSWIANNSIDDFTIKWTTDYTEFYQNTTLLMNQTILFTNHEISYVFFYAPDFAYNRNIWSIDSIYGEEQIFVSAPPDVSTPSPADDAVNVTINANLSVYVSDVDNDLMDVSFINAETDAFIGSVLNVGNGTISVLCENLESTTTYYWYVSVTDELYTTNSSVFSFTTEVSHAPYFNWIAPDNNSIQDPNVPIRCSVYDNDNDSMTVTLYLNDTAVQVTENAYNNTFISYLLGGDYDTTYVFYFSATDGIATTNTSLYFITTFGHPWIYGLVITKLAPLMYNISCIVCKPATLEGMLDLTLYWENDTQLNFWMDCDNNTRYSFIFNASSYDTTYEFYFECNAAATAWSLPNFSITTEALYTASILSFTIMFFAVLFLALALIYTSTGLVAKRGTLVDGGILAAFFGGVLLIWETFDPTLHLSATASDPVFLILSALILAAVAVLVHPKMKHVHWIPIVIRASLLVASFVLILFGTSAFFI